MNLYRIYKLDFNIVSASEDGMAPAMFV